jgi:hypothetical protein
MNLDGLRDVTQRVPDLTSVIAKAGDAENRKT